MKKPRLHRFEAIQQWSKHCINLVVVKSGTATEYFFVLLPFVVITIVFNYQNLIDTIFYIPEWSFAATIILGQSLVKWHEFSFRVRQHVPSEHYTGTLGGCLLSFNIVFALVPSLVTLAIIMITKYPPTWLVIMQILLFLYASCTHFLCGAVVTSVELDFLNE